MESITKKQPWLYEFERLEELYKNSSLHQAKKERNIALYKDHMGSGVRLVVLAEKYGISRNRANQIIQILKRHIEKQVTDPPGSNLKVFEVTRVKIVFIKHFALIKCRTSAEATLLAKQMPESSWTCTEDTGVREYYERPMIRVSDCQAK